MSTVPDLESLAQGSACRVRKSRFGFVCKPGPYVLQGSKGTCRFSGQKFHAILPQRYAKKNGPSSVSTHTCRLRAGLDEPSKPGELGEPCEPGEPSKLGEPGEPSKPGELRAHSQSSPNERF